MTGYDPYVAVETALATCLKSLDTFFPGDKKRDAGWQVSDDDTVISLGGDFFAIYRPGAFTVTKIARGIYDYDWEVDLDLFVRYTSYKESWTKLKSYRASLVELLSTHQTLNGTIGTHGVSLSSPERPAYFRFTDTSVSAKPNYLIQPTRVVIRQRVTHTTGDL